MNPKNSHPTVTEILQYNASLKLPKRKGRIKEIEPIFKTFEPVFTLNTNSNFQFYTK